MRLRVTAFAVLEIVVGELARWFMLGAIRLKCCIRFCRVIPDELLAVCSSPPVGPVVVDGSWNTMLA